MKVTYLYHSGFLIELDCCYLIFDYYNGTLPALLGEKPVLVFSSHSHPDHFNPRIFALLRQQEQTDVLAVLSEDVLSEDVLSEDIPTANLPEFVKSLTVSPCEKYDLPFHIELLTLRSTDAGVAFLLHTPEGVIYHAGDLNDWVWEGESDDYNRDMTAAYRTEIDKLADINVDIAFLPLDPRQEKNYSRGILYFLKNVRVKAVYPMHYWKKPGIIGSFLQEYPQYQEIIRITEPYL